MHTTTIIHEFNLGETIYLKTDIEQLPRLVTEISLCPSGQLVYTCQQGTDYTRHYDFEMSYTIDTELKTSH